MKITEANILVFDTETTGVDPAEARIVDLGAVVIAAATSVEKLHTFVNPGCPIPTEVSQIHGVTDADVADAPTFAELAPRVAERFRGFDVVAGYNAAHYDVPLLNAELTLVRMGLVPDDVNAALAAQAEHLAAEQVEGERWTYWLYTCRQDRATVRIGCGKHIGRPLHEIDPGYLQFMLRTCGDMPEAVRAQFEAVVARRGAERRAS